MNTPSPAALRRSAKIVERLLQPVPAPPLAELAAEFGASAGHLQREFVACTGLSPKRFAQLLAKERLLAALRDGEAVLDAALSAGLSGPGRAHELLLHAEGMTPAQARRRGDGLDLVSGLVDTTHGPLFAAWTGHGLCALEFADEADGRGYDALLQALRAQWPRARWRRDDALLAPLVDAALHGRGTLHVSASHFRLRVWQALLQLPEGALVSYAQLARALGRADAVRAVAGAVAANPLAMLIPCHRVIRDGAELAGYRWGLARKAMLIAAEGGRSTAGQASRTPASPASNAPITAA
jgi:AraC family transcriptional regulator of adaptative response/methylated-DNA-[protein]-cysteine methyltransferase